jgi:antitoxin component of MazEF toxin-antitoxin module
MCGMEISSVVSKWGNSSGIRMPVEILKRANINLNDKLFFDVDTEGRIILTKANIPKIGTIEYLFKDYGGGSFKTEVIDLNESVGNEKW